MATLTQEQRSLFASEWRRWRDDPNRFNTVALRRPPYWWRQREVCQSVVDYRISVVYSGNAIGKSYLTAGVILWWLYTRPGSLVICTAASQTSIGSITFKELRRAAESSPLPMPRMSGGIKASPAVVEVAPGWHGLGYSTTSVERASGQHAENLLVLVDEASGVEDEIWDALDSLKYTRLLALGNPIRAEGRFVDLVKQAEQDKRDGIPPHMAVNAIQIPSTDSPHATWEKSPHGLADATWLDACYRIYGKDSWWVRSHVNAEFPRLSHERLIEPEWLDRAIAIDTERAVEALRRAGKGGRNRISCDVGEGVGNARSVVGVRDDLGFREIVASEFRGPVDTAAAIAELALKYRVAEGDVSYDGAGTTGKRLGNALSGKGHPNARAYFGSGSGGKRFTNLRSASAAAFARRLDPQHYSSPADRRQQFEPFHIPNGPHLPAILEELKALRGQLRGDKYALEDKQDLMDRLGRSPDFADMITQSFREEAVKG